MNPTGSPASAAVTGRSSAALLTILRGTILSGEVAGGDFLPPVRQLCARHELAIETVCKALRTLAREGLVVSVPRRGYRVLPRANDPTRGCPLACVIPRHRVSAGWESLHGAIQSAVEKAAARRGWTAMGISVAEGHEAELGRHLAAVRAWGLILDSMDSGVLQLARDAGIPTVLVDTWTGEIPFDAVLQDNFGGAHQAVRHLLERGHRRLAWLGPISENQHSRERYGGAAAALAEVGLDFAQRIEINSTSPHAADEARKLLARPDRPTAVLALWAPMAVGLASAARELRLTRGRDFEMVCWCAEEIRESAILPALGSGAPPAMVVWRAAEMAEVAVARLAERRANPGQPPARTYIGTRLLLPPAAGRMPVLKGRT
jgi:LacI family transcriptional regulator